MDLRCSCLPDPLTAGVTLVAGPPAIGATSLALRIVVDAVASADRAQALVFSVADGSLVMAERIGGYVRELPDPADVERRIDMDRGLALSAKQIVKRTRGWLRARPDALPLVLVDDLPNVRGVDLRRTAGHEAVRRFARVADELGVVILVCATLPPRRRRDSVRPVQSELLAYGPVLDDCQATILLHRDAYFDRHGDRTHAELIMWSRSRGRHWSSLRWDQARRRFAGAARVGCCI
jgi:hypothetical protein